MVKAAPTAAEVMAQFSLTPAQLEEIRACALDRYGKGMPAFLRVRDKQGKLTPFVPTRIHRKFKQWQRKIAYSVKPRQIFFTSFCEGDYFLDCIEGDGIRCLLVNLDNRTTEEIFDRVHVYNEHFTLPPLLPKPKRETTRKLSWFNGSSFDAITAKNDDSEEAAKTLGRSCTQQRVHVTEAAYMRHYRAFCNGLLDAVPIDGTVVFESTGNGAQGGFYEDCMEIQANGQLVAPGVWHFGDKSLHFFAWWEHPEYTLEADPLPEFLGQLDGPALKKLHESEAEHLAEMKKDASLSREFMDHAMWWRRWMLFNKKGFLRDPDGALAEMDKEYPATLRHAFASTGSAFLSLSLTDERHEAWKRYNADKRLPMRGRVAQTSAGTWRLWPDGEDVLFWAAPYDADQDAWEDRYCIGADVGGGNADSDPDCIWVKDRHLNMYVAVAHGRFGPDKTAEIILGLANVYHGAKVAWEANNHGIGVSIAIWKAGYGRVYRHNEDAPEYKGMGFATNEKTRRIAIQHLKAVYEDRLQPLKIPYLEFYREARAFRAPDNRPDGKVEGQGGVNDDTVMALAITEMLDGSMPAARRAEAPTTYEPGTLGYIKAMAMGGASAGIANVR